MQLLWKYIKQHKAVLFGALGLAIINRVFSLLDPQIIRMIIDNYATRALELERREFIIGVGILLLGYVGVSLISRIAKNFQDYYVNVITQRVGASLYNNSIAHSFSLPYAQFEDQRSGELLQKLEKARNDTQLAIYSFVDVVFMSLIGILFVVVYAFTVHWLVGLGYFLLIPLLGFITFSLSRKIRGAQQKIVTEQADLAGSTTETLRNVELVKSLGLEDQEINRLNTVNTNILGLELEKVKLIRKFSFTQGTIINALRSLLLFLLMWLIFNGTVTIGEFFTLFIYSFFIFTPLAELGTVATRYQEARASLEKLEEILQLEPEQKPSQPVTVGKVSAITFDQVDFRYQSNSTDALENVSLQIKAGETVAFVGPSGSGKTTLVKMLVGLYKPTGGTLRYNDTDASQINFDKFRKRIGLVAQETQLFAGTIRENLLFVNPSASDKECLRVLNLSAASNILDRGGRGLDTKIGEGGLKLSGGERQRLAIARALLRNPDIIIFDEATSSLDSITEKSITETIQNIEATHPELIRVLVAHRLSTIAHADRIFVLEQGRIVEQGSHKQLLSNGELYAALWRQQVAAQGSASKK